MPLPKKKLQNQLSRDSASLSLSLSSIALRHNVAHCREMLKDEHFCRFACQFSHDLLIPYNQEKMLPSTDRNPDQAQLSVCLYLSNISIFLLSTNKYGGFVIILPSLSRDIMIFFSQCDRACTACLFLQLDLSGAEVYNVRFAPGPLPSTQREWV